MPAEDGHPTLGAVVMAAGLGTRMRSATPKHLHPLLGRRMVDWVLEAARELGAEPLVVVASPATADAFDGVERRGPGGAARHRRRRSQRARRARGARRRRPRPLRRHAAAHARRCSASSSTPIARAARAATVLSFEPDDPKRYGRVLRDGNGGLRRDRRGARRDRPSSSRSARSTRRSTSSGPSALWPVLERLTPQNAQGELYLTDSVALLVEDGGRGRGAQGRRPGGDRGREHAGGARGGGGRAPRPDQRGAHARRRDDRRSRGRRGSTPTSMLEPDAVIHPVHGDPRRLARRGRRRGRARTRCSSTPSSGTGALVGPFCYLRPGTVLEAGAKAGTFVEIKNSRIGERTKVPHLSYLGDADVGEDTNIAAGNITVNLEHRTRHEAAHDDRQQRQDRRRQCVRRPRRRSATTHGLQPAPSSPRMYPPARSRSRARAR